MVSLKLCSFRMYSNFKVFCHQNSLQGRAGTEIKDVWLSCTRKLALCAVLQETVHGVLWGARCVVDHIVSRECSSKHFTGVKWHTENTAKLGESDFYWQKTIGKITQFRLHVTESESVKVTMPLVVFLFVFCFLFPPKLQTSTQC